jgi:hypothetical protein
MKSKKKKKRKKEKGEPRHRMADCRKNDCVGKGLLSWLKKGNEVTISIRCLVPFSLVLIIIKDKFWCDVVRMDACHILLGRPLHYGRNVSHEGRSNTYSFIFDNVKIVLMPKKEFALKPPSSRFMDEMCDSG